MSGENNKLFCFGYGYTSDWLAQELMRKGWSIAGTTRDPEKRAFLRSRGVKTYLFDYEHPLGDPYFMLEGVTHVLISTPPDQMGDPTFHMHAHDLVRMPSIKWAGYLSATSVYGDRSGGTVDEYSELRPNSIRGTRRVRAEQEWLSLLHSNDFPVHIFRLAGIYGPGRSALDSVRAGIARRINKPGQVFNRIHVEDIVQVLLASMEKPNPGASYNLSDDDPVPSHEVILYACHLLGIEPPPLIPYNEADMAPIARSFYSDNKRVANHRIKNELGVALKYPNYRIGLEGCLALERSGSLENYLPASGNEN
jgi:nucleoside-diphosphate-sugar epimerase